LITECYPISILPHLSRLFLDFAERREPLVPFYPSSAYSNHWMTSSAITSPERRRMLCDLLEAQNRGYGADGAVLENISRLRNGAAAVVTGQQVSLFGGPLYTLLKAATAIRKAQDASAAGHPHVPIFWMATEDHDLPEANQVTLPAGNEMRLLRIQGEYPAGALVGQIKLGQGVDDLLEEAAAILGPGPLLDTLRRFYRPDATFGEAFAGVLSETFRAHGLIMIDAAGAEFHALGREVLRESIVRADELHQALDERDQQLAAQGYHSQVLVPPQSSLLFLVDRESGARMALKRTAGGGWLAQRRAYSTEDLLAILDAEPERLRANALLRPIFQDALLPTGAYIGGPAEISYFAQSQVLYERLLGRTTPVLPRLSATLIEPAIASILAKHDISLADVVEKASEGGRELAQWLGARALPVAAKRKLAAAGNALDEELTELTGYMQSLDSSLGRASNVAASKMRYQMNRLRRMAASYQVNREKSLERHAEAVAFNLTPNRHPQERVFGGAWFLSRYGDFLPDLLVEHAEQQCPGHKALWL
jgi:bacillithiol synthase